MSKKAFTIYDASAGSGKTYTLVKEYLLILLKSNNNDAYKKILAITFTNKAVEEMKSRIVSSLHEFTKESPNEKSLDFMKVIAAELKLPISTIKEKSKAIIKNIIHNYAAFDISTIDKFTHKVIRAFSHDLGLPPTFDVSLETEVLLQEAVDAIIAKAGEDEVLTRILIDFSVDKTDNDKSWDVTHELLDISRLLINENHRAEIEKFQGKTIEEFQNLQKKLKTEVERLESECVQMADEALGLIEQQGIDLKSFSRGTFPNHLGYIQKGELKSSHKRFYEVEEIQVNKAAKDKDLIESLAPELISILAKVYKNYEKKNFYLAFQKNITPLSLMNSIASELKSIQEDQNVLSISEFNAIIHEEIQKQPAPFIYERLGERYRHFFIDEFQDTSQMQWRNLVPLIDNALASEDLQGERGSLMIVGDPKQSIYRWRGGNAEQFIGLSKAENPFSNKDKELIRLETNFRSYSEVISFNNAFFAMLADEFANPDYLDLYRNKSGQNTNSKSGGYVNISFIPKPLDNDEQSDEEADSKEQLYLKATLQKIKEVRSKGFHYRDIVLLTRKRDSGVALANFLTENDVPILSSESLLIENATEVKLILNVLRYIKNPRDKEAKAGFLYFVGKFNQTTLPIHDFIEQGLALVDEHAFEKWLADFNVPISFKSCRQKSLYEIVELIVAAFIKSKATVSYVQYFLDLVLERDVRTQAGVSDFLEYWEKNASKFSIPSPEGNDAVRIMTIHKSKGLEFPVVIFPFAEEDYSRAPRSKMWLDFEEDWGFPKALVDQKKEVSEYGSLAASYYSTKSEEELLDNINVLYVALTRAEEQLYVISGKNSNSKGELTNNMSSFFIQFLELQGIYSEDKMEFSFGDAERKSKASDLKSEQPVIKIVAEPFDPKKIKIAQREALMWGTDQLRSIEFGNVMHEILSFVRTQSDVDYAVSRALEKALITESNRGEVEATLNAIVNHQELSCFFEDDLKVFNEQNIIGKGMKNSKPDRVAVLGNKAFLLDYKTGAHQSKYEKQLFDYQKNLEAMGLQVEKKALVYIGETIEVVNL